MKIAVAGYGIEGESNYRYWTTDPDNEVTIVDEHMPSREMPKSADTIICENAFSKLQDFDLVIRTAGLAPHKIRTNGKIWSSTNEFLKKYSSQTIGITGTKGKGTTANLVASILEAAGKKVWLVGNMGNPAMDVINLIQPDDIVVYELSSFQLWDLEQSPHIAVVLHIEQDHLDVHKDMSEYINAKKNITKNQSSDDILIYNKSNKYSKIIADSTNARVIGYTDSATAHVKNGYFYFGEQKICSTDRLKLPGIFNLDNACAAIDAAWEYTKSPREIEMGLQNFTGLPHRLQFVREFEGVRYYDDSIATVPGSAIAALRSFEGPKVIILGGSSKGSDFLELGNELTRHEVFAILIGDEADNIAAACRAVGFENFEILHNTTMVDVVNRAQSVFKSGGVVLLSPASASFGMFKDYIDRGNQFVSAVNGL